MPTTRVAHHNNPSILVHVGQRSDCFPATFFTSCGPSESLGHQLLCFVWGLVESSTTQQARSFNADFTGIFRVAGQTKGTLVDDIPWIGADGGWLPIIQGTEIGKVEGIVGCFIQEEVSKGNPGSRGKDFRPTQGGLAVSGEPRVQPTEVNLFCKIFGSKSCSVNCPLRHTRGDADMQPHWPLLSLFPSSCLQRQTTRNFNSPLVSPSRYQ